MATNSRPLPRIAISPCARPGDYDAAIRRAGGTPWTPAIDAGAPDTVVAQAAGVLLPGGEDVDPAWYGEAPHPAYSAAERGRDGFELALARRAVASGTPILAICRGLQVLNVACGGTLVQHIPRDGAFASHSRYPPATLLAHDVSIEPGSRLAALLAPVQPGLRLAVNSRHHQAARRVGHGLVVTARAPDGIVEALEAPTHPFCVAVQWHPESFHRTGAFDWLFEGFVEACRTRG